MIKRAKLLSLIRDRRGIAATEFALIAPALIFLVMGVLEMSFRFRANEEATRYSHEVADLVAREDTLTTQGLREIYNASVYMMKPLETTNRLDFDVAQVGFETSAATPRLFWRRVVGAPVDFNISDTKDMGGQDEAVIRVGIRYHYESVLSNLFGGKTMTIEKSVYARPRGEREITMDGKADDGGATTYFTG
ncbi:MAG TPA: TadE/TadG family type IV pilus assembly protein [Hyphomonadaceae bacterium]|nr:TadE/TadG family type IV pilus assembly protein [Hyphomonadaceae bacterium]